jgi:hypothetical protein
LSAKAGLRCWQLQLHLRMTVLLLANALLMLG